MRNAFTEIGKRNCEPNTENICESNEENAVRVLPEFSSEPIEKRMDGKNVPEIFEEDGENICEYLAIEEESVRENFEEKDDQIHENLIQEQTLE